MMLPAAVYLAFNWQDAPHGWAIPAATDIAFALGVLSLLGTRAPAALKVFLLALAIIDDLGAIVIIAFFYSGNLSLLSLLLAGGATIGLLLLNRFRVRNLTAYLLVGLFLWICVLKSGVHATLAGVVAAAFIPADRRSGEADAPLGILEDRLHPWVAYGIMPLFAFANAGVSLAGVTLDALLEPLPLGIALGLFVGKQAGVFLFSFAAVRLKLASLPQGVSWRQLYGVALLTGIGFTMSLFIGTLAFSDPAAGVPVRLGVLLGTLVSALTGYLWLRWAGSGRASSPR
jgi:NhaA family Na+:H+ antiporter